MLFTIRFVAILCAADLAASATPPETPPGDPAPRNGAAPETAIAPPGDPVAGKDYLLHGDYVGAGIPLKLWKQLNPVPVERLLDRPGVDPSVPDDLNQYVTARGVEVVSGVNCLGCHASMFRGELVIGMGNSLRDWPPGRRSYKPLRLLGELAYRKDSPDWLTLQEFLRGAEVLEGKASVPTRGLNPAFRFEELAAAHREPADLSWREQPGYEVAAEGAWSDVPAWWNVRKKQTLYHNGMGQGDQARLTQQIGVVMMSDAKDAERTLPRMRDLMAYIRTLKPPKHPGPIDGALSAAGERIFSQRCADCHGTYGAAATYPSKLISIEKVGTDPVYAQRLSSSQLHVWFNKSWFAGDGAASADAKLTYVAPPLDGVWCTAPYFHNGSTPTLAGVLNSRKRPDRWRRSFRNDDYDVESPGWRYEELPARAAGDGPRSREDYDTSIPGCGNGGHTFGDDLTDEERRAVIEYLKTL